MSWRRDEGRTTINHTRAANSPHLALVLGSGGVRSVAALGISEVLVQRGLRARPGRGLQLGCVVRRVHRDGHDRRAGAGGGDSGCGPRSSREQKRWSAYLELIAPRLMRFDAGFSLRDARLIRERVERAFGDARLEDLPIPLRVVATDAATGDSRGAHPRPRGGRGAREHGAAVHLPERGNRRAAAERRRDLRSAAGGGGARCRRHHHAGIPRRDAAAHRPAVAAGRAGDHGDDQQPAAGAHRRGARRGAAHAAHRARYRPAHRAVGYRGHAAYLRSRPARRDRSVAGDPAAARIRRSQHRSS